MHLPEGKLISSSNSFQAATLNSLRLELQPLVALASRAVAAQAGPAANQMAGLADHPAHTSPLCHEDPQERLDTGGLQGAAGTTNLILVSLLENGDELAANGLQRTAAMPVVIAPCHHSPQALSRPMRRLHPARVRSHGRALACQGCRSCVRAPSPLRQHRWG